MLFLGGTREMLVGCVARSLESRGTLLAEQLSWMAEPWVPGAWDPQLFLPGKLLGRGRGRVPLGAGRRAVSVSSNPEGNTLTPLKRHGLPPHPPRALRHLQSASLSPGTFCNSSTPVPTHWKSGSVLAQT